MGYTPSFWKNSMVCDNDNNLYITGYFRDSLLYDGYTQYSAGNYDLFVMKVNKNGGLQWLKFANDVYGDYSYSIARDNSNNFYITGRFYDTAWFGNQNVISYGNGTSDMFVAKLHEVPVSVAYNELTSEITIFPNPVHKYLNILSPGGFLQKVEIVSIDGKTTYTFTALGTDRIDVSGFANGNYIIRLYYGNAVFAKKIVIE
ncbi:MAG: T9SS type A sorting domain-containing protein [Bacteroidia bacterium]|nr:T9SS type A sorting domain-containing protein [Bacteroidia bacterium]